MKLPMGTHRASQIEGALHFNAVTARYAGAPQAACATSR